MLSDFSKSTVKLRTSNENSKKKKKKKKTVGQKFCKSGIRFKIVMEMRFQINGKFKLTALSIKRHTCCAQITTIFVMS